MPMVSATGGESTGAHGAPPNRVAPRAALGETGSVSLPEQLPVIERRPVRLRAFTYADVTARPGRVHRLVAARHHHGACYFRPGRGACVRRPAAWPRGRGAGLPFAVADADTDEAVGQVGSGCTGCARAARRSATGSGRATGAAAGRRTHCGRCRRGGSPCRASSASSCTSSRGTSRRGGPPSGPATCARRLDALLGGGRRRAPRHVTMYSLLPSDLPAVGSDGCASPPGT